MPNLAYCGLDCSKCDFTKTHNCPTCHVAKGDMKWGNWKCPIAECNITKGFENCSQCKEFPCELLNKFAYDKEQGDNGKRIDNLRNLLP